VPEMRGYNRSMAVEATLRCDNGPKAIRPIMGCYPSKNVWQYATSEITLEKENHV